MSPSSNLIMPSEHVYQGVWSKWDGYPWIRVWTVTNLNAIIIMAFVTTLLAFTQSRAWIIVRYLFLRITRSNRLPDQLDTLSQQTAIKMMRNYFAKLLCLSPYRQEASKSWEYEPPVWIAFWATLNFLGFVVAGAILPWFLTDGALGAPEVRSQGTQHCGNMWLYNPGRQSSELLMPLSESIWRQCHDKEATGYYCNPNFVDTRLYSISLDSHCIFPSKICLKEHPTATFIITNITAHDLGINSNLKITVSQRIRCSPILLDPFIHKSEALIQSYGGYEYGKFILSIRIPQFFLMENNSYDPEYDMNMLTDNGPNSGWQVFQTRLAPNAKLLPANMGIFNDEYRNQIMDPFLKIPDTETFILVYRAGRTLYHSRVAITDPLFEARNTYRDTKTYIPTREATGIGCIHQVQVCTDLSSIRKCYPWTNDFHLKNLMQDLQHHDNNETASEYDSIFVNNLQGRWRERSVSRFLAYIVRLPGAMLASRRSADFEGFLVERIDADRQWILTLTNIFNKARYWQKLSVISKFQPTYDWQEGYSFPGEDLSLCDKILLVDADFTNINWVGMWLTVVLLCFVCLVSYGIALLEWASRNNVSLMDRDTWQHLRTNASEWIRKNVGRAYGISFKLIQSLKGLYEIRLGGFKWIEKSQDVPMDLRVLEARASRTRGEEPDNPIE